MNTEKLNQAVSQAQQKTEGFAPSQQPKTTNRKANVSNDSVAESDKAFKQGQLLQGKAAAQDVVSDIGDYMAVYKLLYPVAKETAKQSFILENQSQTEQRESLDADKFLTEIGMNPKAFSEALGKQMEIREARLSLPSIPQLLLPSVSE